MNQAGVTLVTRVALMIVMSLVVVYFRVLVGRGKRRGRIMMLGTLGGLTFGVLVAYPLSGWLAVETSPFCACLGIILGWTVAWQFARQIPREAN